MFDTTVHTVGERSIKTENYGVSMDFQRFLDRQRCDRTEGI